RSFLIIRYFIFFFFQAEDGIRDPLVTGVQTCALPILLVSAQTRLSIDPARLYLAGFSGTARVALRLAVALRGHVAGVIAVGGARSEERRVGKECRWGGWAGR